MGLQVLNLVLVGSQPEFHVLGHRAHVDIAVAIGQNLLGTVIARHDDKAVGTIENVINRRGGQLGVHLGMSELQIGHGSCEAT